MFRRAHSTLEGRVRNRGTDMTKNQLVLTADARADRFDEELAGESHGPGGIPH